MNRVTSIGFCLLGLVVACGDSSGDGLGGSGGGGGEDTRPPSTPGTACSEGVDYKSACEETQRQICTMAGTWSACIPCQYGVLEECDDGEIHCWDAGSSPCGVPPGSPCAEPGTPTGCDNGSGQQLCLSSSVWSECLPCGINSGLEECPGGEIVCEPFGAGGGGGSACP